MALLQFYLKEFDFFEIEHDILLTREESVSITKQLCEDLHFTVVEIEFKHGVRWSWAHTKTKTITLGSRKADGIGEVTTLASLIHELGHLFTHQKYNNYHHNKLLWNTLIMFHNYLRKRNEIVKTKFKELDDYNTVQQDEDKAYIACPRNQ